MNSVEVGDLLYHHSASSDFEINPDRSGVVYFGQTRESISHIGGSGFLHTFQVNFDLGKLGQYADHFHYGINHRGWVSIPAGIASDCLEHLATQASDF